MVFRGGAVAKPLLAIVVLSSAGTSARDAGDPGRPSILRARLLHRFPTLAPSPLVRSGGRLRSAANGHLDVALPDTSAAPVVLSLAGDARIEITSLHAPATPGELVDRLIVFRGEPTVTYAVDGTAFEELRWLETPVGRVDSSWSIRTDLELRVHDQIVEAIDDGGRTRWRTEPMIAVDAKGRARTLGVDLQPGPDGDRVLHASLDTSDLAFPLAIDPRWTPAEDLIDARERHVAVALSTNEVLVCGGQGIAGTLATCERFDATKGTWSAAAKLPVARVYHAMTLLPSGKVLLTGGASAIGAPPSKAAYLYDPEANTWTTTTPMGSDHQDHLAILLPEVSKVLIPGRPASEAFDIATSAWEPRGGMQKVHGHHEIVLLGNGRVLAAGGGFAETYKWSEDAWSLTSPMKVVRGGHEVVALADGDGALAIGGFQDDGKGGFVFLSSVQRFDSKSGEWTLVGELSTGRNESTATLLPDGRVLVTGGSGLAGAYSGKAEAFDPATGVFQEIGTLYSPTYLHAAALVPEGVVICGGETISGTKKSLLKSTTVFACKAVSDGICCDKPCGSATDDCMACSVAAGAPEDGTCAPVSDGTGCAGGGHCLRGVCEGAPTAAAGASADGHTGFYSCGMSARSALGVLPLIGAAIGGWLARRRLRRDRSPG